MTSYVNRHDPSRRQPWRPSPAGFTQASLHRPATTAATQAESRFAGVLIGLQSYSFRDLSIDDGIAAMQRLGITSCELWEGHVEPAELRRRENRERLRRWRTTIPLDWFQEIRWQFENAGIEINAYNLSFKDHFRMPRSTAASRWRRNWERRPSPPRRR